MDFGYCLVLFTSDRELDYDSPSAPSTRKTVNAIVLGLLNMLVTEAVDPGWTMVGLFTAQAMPSNRMGTVEVGAVPTSGRQLGRFSNIDFE